MIQKSRLKEAPYRLIESGVKTIEARIYDEKRRELNIGDEIWYYLNEYDAPEVLKMKVKELIVTKTFKELFDSRSVQDFGGKSVEDLLQNIFTIYSKDEEVMHGVVGVVLEKS